MSYIYSILIGVYTLLIIFTIAVIVLENRNPVRTQAWIVVLLFVPVGGLVLYLFFGENIKRQRAYRKKRKLDKKRINHLNKGYIEEVDSIKSQFSKAVTSKFNLVKMLLKDRKSLLTLRNEVEIFNNGESKFSALIEDLKAAKKFIHMQYYIIANDNIGTTIKEILIAKAAEGVEVRVLFDDVGSLWIGKKYVKELKRAGVKIFPFMPVVFTRFTRKLNYRNHRKLVIIDGKHGYIGGMNISDRYITGDALGLWRDTHLRIQGEAVMSLQALFLIDWYYESDEEMDDENYDKYFPETDVQGKKLIQMVSNGPDTPESSITDAYFLAITTARKSICISTPYLLPTQTILAALRTSALSGVEVKIIIPFHSDTKIAHHASLSYIDRLLKSGVRVFQYKTGFTHAKVMLVDDAFSSVGSANMDYRSLEHNFEVNALIYDEEVNAQLRDDFEMDLVGCEEIIYSEWANRPGVDKIRQSLARVLAPLF